MGILLKDLYTMTLNPQYEAIGRAFVQRFYMLFDDAAQRPQLAALYKADQSLMTFEGVSMQGAAKIMEKISSLTFQRIAHSITAIDCQPMFDGGILINVLGQLKTDEDPPHSFLQTFVLQNSSGNWFIGHDVFRLSLHDMSS